MTGRDETKPASWDAIESVVFDVDGTLYDHLRLRIRMTRLLLGHCLQSRTGWRNVRIVQAFRRCREELAEAEASQIESRQFALPAERLAVSEGVVRDVIQEWMDERPLPFLRGYTRPGVHALFDALHRSGRKIGILSDYPVERKLAAMGLRADVLASAVDPHIDRLKPHPAGLLHVIERLGCKPEASLMIGDRCNRDGEAARRAGARFLRVGRPQARDASCRDFLDPIFQPIINQRDAAPAHIAAPNIAATPTPERW
jgi:putative hydrolase of the HAD superfamily